MDAELAGSLWESQDSKRGPVLSHGSAAPSMTQIQAPPWKAVSVPAKHGGGAVHTSEVVHESKGWFYLKKKRGSIKTSSLAQRIYSVEAQALAFILAIFPAGQQKMLL